MLTLFFYNFFCPIWMKFVKDIFAEVCEKQGCRERRYLHTEGVNENCCNFPHFLLDLDAFGVRVFQQGSRAVSEFQKDRDREAPYFSYGRMWNSCTRVCRETAISRQQ
jgi:hypothetical protein